MPEINPNVLARITPLWSLYQEAGNAENVHPVLLAAIDYRECDNAPDRSTLSGERIGERNPDDPNVVTATKLDSLYLAARHVREMAEMVYGVKLTAESRGEAVKLAMLAYNRGFMYQRVGMGPDRSPYVMNDPAAPMIWPDNPGEPPQTRGRVESGRYGAYRVFESLAGSLPAPLTRKDYLMFICGYNGEAWLCSPTGRVRIIDPKLLAALNEARVPNLNMESDNIGAIPAINTAIPVRNA